MNITDKISVVIPTLNEGENIPRLVSEFVLLSSEFAFNNIDEIIFVDDGSYDGTIEIIENLKDQQYPFKIRLLERGRKKGTASAAIDGARFAKNETVVVMDADMQHPPYVITELAKRDLVTMDIIVASRHVQGGGIRWSPVRGVISRTAIIISHVLVKSSRKVKDPTSGYFMTRKEYIANLLPQIKRTKILLYIIASHPEMKIDEVPYIFVDRKNGNSKVVTRKLSFITDFLIELIGYMKVNRKSLIRSKIRDSKPQTALNK